jgi:hypothetical protein
MKKTNVTVACCALIAPLAFCASAFAGPSENVVLPAKQQSVQSTGKKVYYVVTASSAIPQPFDRLAAIPTTATPMKIFGHATTR